VCRNTNQQVKPQIFDFASALLTELALAAGKGDRRALEGLVRASQWGCSPG